jgi:hypothetical protein
MGGVDDRGRQVQLPGGAQLAQDLLVQLLPEACGAPLIQPPPAGRPGHPEQAGRDTVPANPVAQHPQDPLQRRTVIGTPPSRMLEPPRTQRDQRLQPRPNLVSQDLLVHTGIVEDPDLSNNPTRRLILN